MLRVIVLTMIGVNVVATTGCKPIVVPAPTRKNELKIDDRSGEKLARVTVKWTGDDLVWEKECRNCHGTKEDGGHQCKTCNGTGSLLSPDRNVIFKLPITGTIEPTFQITVQFLDGTTVSHEHKTKLVPEERKLITATIHSGRKIAVQEKQRNPHIE